MVPVPRLGLDPGNAGGRQGRGVTTGHGDLIVAAEALLRPHRVGDRLFGDVGASLVTAAGNRYGGVCIDTGSGTGCCAEHSAIAARVTAGEYQIARRVARTAGAGDRVST